jgi:PTH1 family peptidyl-tRNA hydrolase
MTVDQPSDLLIVGLGNPGPEYAGTRHNVGFECVAELASRLQISIDRRRWKSRVGSGDLPGRPGSRLWLQQPQTMMNLSGAAVAAAARDLRLPPDRIWVVHDELDLPLCRLRIKRGGSAAGHNGIASIIGALGSQDFVRFRVGVGKPPRPRSGAGYVLGRFGKAEKKHLAPLISGVALALQKALEEGLEAAMGLYNRAGSLGCEEAS